jgi:hypothetical protein
MLGLDIMEACQISRLFEKPLVHRTHDAILSVTTTVAVL